MPTELKAGKIVYNMEKSSKSQFFTLLPDGKLRCEVCPQHCRLNDGQRGFCYVRQRQGDRIVLTCYGMPSGLSVDPIEKKPLYHFLPGSSVLSFGTVGCNLACRFCQNWNLVRMRNFETTSRLVLPQQIADTAEQSNCISVAFTYNEPTIFIEYAIDCAALCRERNIKTVAVTNGYISNVAAQELYDHIDAANVDLKAFNDNFYKKLCSGSLQPVLDTLVYLVHKTKVWVEITNLIIPGENDDRSELEKMTTWIVKELGPDIPIHFSAFYPAYRMQNHSSTTHAALEQAREIALAAGTKYVYLGNTHDQEGMKTYCHGCRETVIERKGHVLTSLLLSSEGVCKNCGSVIPGVFSN